VLHFLSSLLLIGTSIEIKKVFGKDFSFEKGRYMLLNWYINQIQQLQLQQWPSYNPSDLYNMNEESAAADDTLANQNIFLMDPEEGNKTHAYLQLEGLIHLDHSHLTVSLVQGWIHSFYVLIIDFHG
jgi:DNA mismatch repair protein MSH5